MAVIGMNGMKSTRNIFRQTHRAGAKRRAIVEKLKIGKATVRLVGTNVRMTNLNVVGYGIEEGDLVYVEYGGIKPVVKPAGKAEQERLKILGSGGKRRGDVEAEPSSDVGARVYRSTNLTIPYNTWTPIPFNTVDWDSSNIWTPVLPERMTAPQTGNYLVLFHWAWQKTDRIEYDEWNAYNGSIVDHGKFLEYRPNTVRIMHSRYQEVFMKKDYHPFYDVVDTRDSLMFSTYLLSGEYLWAEIITKNSWNESRVLLGSNLYPRMTLQLRTGIGTVVSG